MTSSEQPDAGRAACPWGSPESAAAVDPRHVFLDAKAVIRRYGWGRSKGYQNLKNRDLIPAPVMVAPDRWRLDQLLAWEDRRIAAQMPPIAPQPPPNLCDLLPPPKRMAKAARRREQ